MIFEKGENMKFKKTLAIFVILIVGLGITGIAAATNFDTETSEGLTLLQPVLRWFKEPVKGEVSLTTDKGNYCYGEQIHITITNDGDKDAYYCGSYNHWIIEKYEEGNWNRIYPEVEICVILNDYISPGEQEKDIWDADVSAGDYRVVVSYYVKEPKYRFTEYCYFSVEPLIVQIEKAETVKIPEIKVMKLPDPEIVSSDEMLASRIIKMPEIETSKIDISCCKHTNLQVKQTKNKMID